MTQPAPEQKYVNITKEYDVVIGIEVHCQLATQSKMFSSSKNSYGDAPNSNLDETCLGLPGALPVLNDEGVNLACRMALALHSQVQRVSVFSRKNYFYPDLPKGYQITQYDRPLSFGGYLELPSSGKRIGIERIQLEEDAGKNIHVGEASFIDYNRSGVGLIEIVSDPDLSSPEEASEYLRKLHSYVVNLGVSDGDMEKGNFRADANISLKPKGSKTFGERCEIKNVNSFKYIEKALHYEIARQYELLSQGQKIVKETRGFDSEKGITVSQRTKESAHDYRYFPEPDLPPLVVTEERLQQVINNMPELPEAAIERFQKTYGLLEYDAKVIASLKRNRTYFEDLIKALNGICEAKMVANYFMTDLLRMVKIQAEKQGVDPEDLADMGISIEHSAELLSLQQQGVLSQRLAKEVFELMATSSPDQKKSPKEFVQERGLEQVLDRGLTLEVCQKVLTQNPTEVESYRSGKTKLFGFFVGEVMKQSQGRLNPGQVNEVLKDLLKG